MTLTILYLNPCRRNRLRAAFSTNIHLLGPMRTAQLVNAITEAYNPHRSPRVNYNHALHALHYAAGLIGLSAIAIVKEAWNTNSLRLAGDVSTRPAANITHPSTITLQ